MPRRKQIFGTGEYYHVFNRSIFRNPIFAKGKDATIFLEILRYYTQVSPSVKYSYFRKQAKRLPLQFDDRLVTLISFCLMPNHFHVCIRQEKDDGVQRCMQRAINSFSHYFQTKYHRRGPLFESVFLARHIETEEQLLHLTRYHHLNPVTAYITDHPGKYQHSSYLMYTGTQPSIVDTSVVMSQFSSADSYEQFVLDRIGYQRELDLIQHLIADPGSS